MAAIICEGLTDMILALDKLGEIGHQTAVKMVEAGSAQAAAAWENVARSHGYRKTGAMIGSIGPRGPVAGRGTVLYQTVYPQGSVRRGKSAVTNAEKAFYLHYGTQRGGVRRVRGSYWVDEVESQAEEPVFSAMEQVYDDFVADSLEQNESGGNA